MLLKNANDDNTYYFGIKMIWRAVAVSFSEAHPFVFACFVCKIQYLFFLQCSSLRIDTLTEAG